MSEPTPRRRSPALIFGALILVFLCGGGAWTALTWGEVSTDNAQVEGHVVTLGARVAGTVAHVLVEDNQAVRAGDALVELDPRDLDARLSAAEADLAGAQAAVDVARAQLQALSGGTAAQLEGASAGVDSARAAGAAASAAVEQARAALTSARARAEQAAADRQRGETLLASGGLTKQAQDALITADTAAQSGLSQAQAGLAAAEQNAVAAQGRLEEARARYAQATTGDAQVAAATAQVRIAEARAQQAAANAEIARLQRSWATISAPFDGVVARRAAEPGQVVAPGTVLIGLVGTAEVWVTANFKETQVAEMVPGQRVEVEVDGVSGPAFEGSLQGLSAATGSRFSLLPPDNASGNFTKVVQRVPVHVTLPADALGKVRPGMSAVVTVHTR